mgnify:CR=1 FL=1
MSDGNISVIVISLFIGWLLLCAITDLRWHKLPNVLTLGACLPALTVLIFQQHSLLGASLSSALTGWCLAMLLTLPAYAVGWLGAGDVKMFSAMGLMTGWLHRASGRNSDHALVVSAALPALSEPETEQVGL